MLNSFETDCLLWLFLTCLLITPAQTHTSDIVAPLLEQRDASVHDYDVIIYGSTVAGLAAAIQTIRMGKTAAVVSPSSTIGGLTTSGLGWTDSKNGSCIGGIAREFYEKVYSRYEKSSLWKQEDRSTYASKKIRAQPGPAVDERRKVQWTFEPKVAEAIWEDWMREEGVPVFRNSSLKRSRGGVQKDGANITSLISQDGSVFQGKMFIDASYDGDLMDGARVPWRVGRESRKEYNESAAGFNINEELQHLNIDPFKDGNESGSALIDGIGRVMDEDIQSLEGDADPLRLQAYNYRLCLTKEPDNQVPFSKPDEYDEGDFEILLRYIDKSGYRGTFFTASPMPNLKTDTNAKGEVSTDLVGGNYNNISNYAEWSDKERESAARRHKTWTQGLLWTLANHPDVPSSIRKSVGVWGYAKDEFVSNDNWPYELYIREGRRMSGVYTMKQNDIQYPASFPDDSVVATGSYTFDVHRVERVVVKNKTYNEGFVHQPNRAPFSIPYGAIIPEAGDAINFLNPVTMSSTHIAFAAIRMEPTYMILGQSAATAAVLAIEAGVKVQDVDRSKLTARLKADSQVVAGNATTNPPGFLGLFVAMFVFVIVHYSHLL